MARQFILVARAAWAVCMSYHTPDKFGQPTPGKNQAKANTANSFLLSPMPEVRHNPAAARRGRHRYMV
jgi:hypothetical protein